MVRLSRLVALFAIFAAVATGCSSGAAQYKPPLLPIIFTIDLNGNIAIAGSARVITPLGEFSIQGNVFDTIQNDADKSLLVVIRNRRDGIVLDRAYRVSVQQELVAVLNGNVEVRVTKGRVFVDASNGDIKSIELRPTGPQPVFPDQSPPPTATKSGVLLVDPLTSADRRKGLNSYCSREIDGYHIRGDAGTCTVDLENLDKADFGDADISVTVSWLSGKPSATYGVNFRGYYLTFNGDNQWRLNHRSGRELIPLARNPAIKPDINRIRIRSLGTHLEFFVNDVKLGATNDSTQLHGSVGFHGYCGGYCGRNHVVFSDLIVQGVD